MKIVDLFMMNHKMKNAPHVQLILETLLVFKDVVIAVVALVMKKTGKLRL